MIGLSSGRGEVWNNLLTLCKYFTKIIFGAGFYIGGIIFEYTISGIIFKYTIRALEYFCSIISEYTIRSLEYFCKFLVYPYHVQVHPGLPLDPVAVTLCSTYVLGMFRINFPI